MNNASNSNSQNDYSSDHNLLSMNKEHSIIATRIRRHNKLVKTLYQSCLIKHKTCKMRLNFKKCVNCVEFERLVTQCEMNIRDFIE